MNNIRRLPDEWECHGCGKTVKVEDMVVRDAGRVNNFHCPHCDHKIVNDVVKLTVTEEPIDPGD